MKIAISSGHGAKIAGAIGPSPWGIDEHKEAVRVVDRVTELLNANGVPTEKFEDKTSTSQDENLETIVHFHNHIAEAHDLDVSVHFNSTDPESGVTGPIGTEVWYLSQSTLAAAVSEAIADAGDLLDRGPKKSTGLYFLTHTEEPAVLIEVCFVMSKSDCELYRQNFDAICGAIAASLSGEDIEGEPEQPAPPERPGRPARVPIGQRPTLREGDDGPDVLDMQRMIPRFTGEFDGDFGPTTHENVVRYQRSRGLEADGICGPQTWEALYRHKLPVAPAIPPDGLTVQEQTDIMQIANESEIADYDWDDRGVAPTGFTQGMALSFAQTLKKFWADHPAVVEAAKARTGSDKDVFNVYRDEFNELGMSNERAGIDTLRHLWAFMLGSGMRESSGQHCCGRDQSASNYDSDTCEAGAFQTSYNASNASEPEFDNLMDEFLEGLHPGYLDAWSEGVSCSSADWESYGSGRGLEFQELCKNSPAFSAETHALTLRNLCNHYGPVIRGEVELRRQADVMFKAVQEYMEAGLA